MILYIDDVLINLELFRAQMESKFEIQTVQSTKQAYSLMLQHDFKVVVTDQRMPLETGIEFIERIKDEFPDVIYIVLTAYDDTNIERQALNTGMVYRFLIKPWDPGELSMDLQNALDKYELTSRNKKLLEDLRKQNKELKVLKKKLEGENIYLKSEIKLTKNFETIITEDSHFIGILNSINQIAESDASVLITGETGTGKELIARAVHNLSQRREEAFISINCAAIPDTLLETELFGHEKGAFTGAINTKKGRFELAQDGSLFLDEIGEIPVNMQPKLLRAIEEGSIERIGGNKTIKLNIRIICATNRNLKFEIKDGNFRSDLYYRINVFHVELPPLRHRKNDVPLLTQYFIRKFNKKYKKHIQKVPNKKMMMLQSYQWPGNIRELENIIERAVIISDSDELNLELDHLFGGQNSSEGPQTEKLIDLEKKQILKILGYTSWKIGGKDGAAEVLGLNRTTLLARMKKLDIVKKA